MMKKTIPLLLFASLVVVYISGCNPISTNNGASPSNLQTSVSFQSASGSTTQTPSVTYTDSTTSDSITIDSAKLLIGKLLFYGNEDEAAEDSTQKDSSDNSVEYESEEHQNEDSVEVKFRDKDNVFKTGPYVLNINLDSTVSSVGITDLPHGTYNKIMFLIRKHIPGEDISDSDFTDTTGTDSTGRAQYFSIIVKGNYNGKPFVFRSHETFFVMTKLNPPLVVSDSLNNYNATIQVNVSHWFTDEDGHIIDPTDPANEFRIDWAIRHSFHAFEDDNHDGHGDHHSGDN